MKYKERDALNFSLVCEQGNRRHGFIHKLELWDIKKDLVYCNYQTWPEIAEDMGIWKEQGEAFAQQPMDDPELDPSELGTQDYWQKAYTKEIENFVEHGDPGDVWFGEDSANRVIDWICNCGAEKDTALIDLGCGNGYTLSELAREGFTNLLGVDYCQEAITLAEKVSKTEFPHIKYKVFDITQDCVKEIGKFGIVHDKGTYDAIGLNPEDPKKCREKYIDQVVDMLDEEGLFIITSCNWTEEELLKHFSEKMKLKRVIPTPQFKFGGKVGSVVSSVVFTKK